MAPIAEMGLPIKAESRTGDTGMARRQRQRVKPPDILLTTPEQLALFCAWEGARRYFEDLRCVIIDEVHAIWPSKRGDLLSLDLARLQQFAPNLRRVGLSATVDDPDVIRRWLTPDAQDARRSRASARPGAPPVVDVLLSEGDVPWAGHTAQPRDAGGLRGHQAGADRPGVRQHPVPGRVRLPGAVAAQRRQPADRPAPRLALGRAAAEGRGGDGPGRAARRGLHLDARSRHRLGRRRPRHPARLAQGRVAHGAADRPRQPPAGRTQPRPVRARQPLRDAGVPGRARGDRRERARRRAGARRRARCAGPARDGLRLLRAVRPRCALRRGAAPPAPTATSPGRTSRRWSISSPPAATP